MATNRPGNAQLDGCYEFDGPCIPTSRSMRAEEAEAVLFAIQHFVMESITDFHSGSSAEQDLVGKGCETHRAAEAAKGGVDGPSPE